MFKFSGTLDSSKSWMNRALIIQSFSANLKIQGYSSSDDVHHLQKAMQDLSAGRTEFYAGLGGTTFRFLALRLSREKGRFLIKAESSLLSRPQSELLNIFSQLGVRAGITPDGFWIQSDGWKEPKALLKISTEESSQFLSAVLLSAINLDFDLHIKLGGEFTSEDYYKYTLKILENSGIKAIQFEDSLFYKKHQTVSAQLLVGEVDVSSAFSLVAAGVLSGEVEILNWKNSSTQPDMQFTKFFQQMGIQFDETDHSLKVKHQSQFKSLKADISQCPDLFPVLSVLCAFADGDSHLYGAYQLKYKESDRITKTVELLTKCGFEAQPLDDGIKIQGNSKHEYLFKKDVLFDPEHDHRMAMAAAILNLKKFPVNISEPSVINKSYPQFYQHIGLET